MVRNNSQFNRRKVLKATGTTITGIASYSSISGADGGKQPVSAKGPEFSDDMSKGYALGHPDNPVDAVTIKQIQEKILSRQSSGGVLIDDPTARPAEEYQSDNDTNQILGYGFKMENGTPSILIKRTPVVISSSGPSQRSLDVLPEVARTAMTRNIHSQIRDFINNNGGDE